MAARVGVGLYDGDLELAICMDIVHDAFNRAFKCDVGRGPGDLLGSDRFTDVFIAFSRLSGGRFWPARPSLNWRNAYS